MEAATFNVTPESFQNEVIERSESMPVLVLFWAEQVPPSVQSRQTLESLIGQYQGKAALALSDVAQDQSLAQHLRVQGLPSLRVVHKGQIVDQLDGPADEAQLRSMLDALTQSPTDVLKAQLDQILASGDFDTAAELLQQAVNEEPNNFGFRVELADVLVRKGDLLAAVSDPFGEKETEILAPFSGIIVGRAVMPIVNEGDAVFHIGRVKSMSEAEGAVEDLESQLEDDPMFDEDEII